MSDLPLPNDIFGGAVVVASTWLNDNYRSDFPRAEFDELALILLLKPTSPYYSVRQITRDGDGPWLFGSDELAKGDDCWNIVFAVECYSNNGGDV